MKFGEQLGSHLTPEWRKQYVQYEELKKLLYDPIVTAPGPEEPEKRVKHMDKVDASFMDAIEKELTKINLFFSMKIAEAQRKFNEMHHDLEAFKKEQAAKGKMSKSLSTMKFAFSEFYLSLVLIQNYQQLNSTGLRKILKKHDKLLERTTGKEYFEEKVRRSQFVTNKEVDSLLAKTENIVTNDLEGGNRSAAMKRLRVQPMSETQSAWTTFRLGLYLGAFVLCCLITAATLVHEYSYEDANEACSDLFNRTIHDDDFYIADKTARCTERKWIGGRLFRGFLLLFVNCWLMGLNVYGWQGAGVNHVLIFEINPRDHLTYQSLMEIASLLCMIWGIAVVGYLYAHLIGVPPLVFPLGLMLICLVFIFNPINIMYRSSRYWFLKKVGICLTAPFHHVAFPDFWLGDQMNSLVTSFLDFGYFMCFFSTQVDYFGGNGRDFVDFKLYGSVNEHGAPDPLNDTCVAKTAWWRPLITMIPAMVRFLQCLRRYRDSPTVHPHLTNAGKYCTSFLVIAAGTARSFYSHVPVLENPLFYFWLFSYVLSFCYTYYWDLFMDWSLMQPNYGYLREELAYTRKWYYYFAIVEDGLLRLSWTLNVSLAAAGNFLSIPSDILLCITGILECFRRFVWNFIRLENEHVNNIGKFRAVRDISLKVIKKGALESLIERMDSEDGVKHRGEEVVGKKPKHALQQKIKPTKSSLKLKSLGLKGKTNSKVSFLPTGQTAKVGDSNNAVLRRSTSTNDSLEGSITDMLP